MGVAEALKKTAVLLEQEAASLRRRAAEADLAQARRRILKQARHDLLKRLRNREKVTAQDLARHYGLPPETIAYWLREAIKEEAREKRRLRDRRICLMARAGKTNRAIAESVRLHEKSVQRIISRDLKRLLGQLHSHKD